MLSLGEEASYVSIVWLIIHISFVKEISAAAGTKEKGDQLQIMV